MDPNAIAGMAFTLILAAMVGGFVLLFPVSRRLGKFLENRLQDKKGTPALPPAEFEALQETVKSLESQLRRVGERQEFLEKLLSSKQAAALPPKDV